MHDLKALIGKAQDLAVAAQRLANGVLCALPQGYALLPITNKVAKELREWPNASLPVVSDMANGVASLACETSMKGPVVYISTEYFGGTGGQDAIVWRSGELVAKYLNSEIGAIWPNSAISQALRSIGVQAAEGQDEFDTLGLGNPRDTERWANKHAAV